MQNTHLLIIDPQHDFCDPSGALFVPGAEKDMERLAAFVGRVGDKLSKIHVTLDSHHYVDIAHPVFWKDSSGKHPDPFTIISKDDVKNGVWTTTKPGWHKKALAYVEQLEANNRYLLCVWPPHCLIGSRGYEVVPDLMDALTKWTDDHFGFIDWVAKGHNPFTEHYSGVAAEVPDPQDPATQINTNLVKTLTDADVVLIAGEASSHCLANTVRDIANNFNDDSYIQKLVLLEDATSPVPSFENLTDDFTKEMTGRGMQLSSTTEWMK